TGLHSALVRDFVRGDLGVISQRSGDGLIVEFTPEGLMALNRGTVGGRTIVVTDVRRPLDEPGNVAAGPDAAPLLPHLPAIARLTAALTEARGPCTLEWVVDRGEPYFVDYSVLGGSTVAVSATGGVQISPGTATGPLLRIEEDDLLGRLSIGPAVSIDRSADVLGHEGLAVIIDRVRACPRKPVVHVSRPYAVLSVLIGSVAGFVFDQGSTLGHLAILLREAGVPAVAAASLTGQGEATISGGTVIFTGTGLEGM
ncbi:MAG TPA: PEP-utilizing enzyme, partial [Pseudonocardiaceae bacterium]|nr:PEP-utilizing enzyme [Pseudonocardiaceae bacterium]